MSETNTSIRDRIQAWNENGRLYLYVGVLSAVGAWFLAAVLGIVAVFCGYRLVERERTLAGGIIAAVGGAGFLLWALALTLL